MLNWQLTIKHRYRIDRPLIEAASSLKVISQMAVACDNTDILAATAHSIPVGHTPGILTDATAQSLFTPLCLRKSIGDRLFQLMKPSAIF